MAARSSPIGATEAAVVERTPQFVQGEKHIRQWIRCDDDQAEAPRRLRDHLLRHKIRRHQPDWIEVRLEWTKHQLPEAQ